VKKIVQGLKGKILPSPPKGSALDILSRVVREAWCAVPSLFCCLYRYSVILPGPAAGVETHTA